jgi:hypothetical protein
MFEEGAHITVPPPLGFCATKSKADGFTFFIEKIQRCSTEEASEGMPTGDSTGQWFVTEGVGCGTIHP